MGSGRGKVRIFVRGPTILLLIDAVTTRSRDLKALLRTSLAAHTPAIRPSFAPFAVRIDTSVLEDARLAFDVDNIAKAALDACTGLLWQDDRQVVRLWSERFAGPANRIALRAAPLAAPLAPVTLDAGLLEFGLDEDPRREKLRP